MADKRPDLPGPRGIVRVLRPVAAPGELAAHDGVPEVVFSGAGRDLLKVERGQYLGALLEVECEDGITLAVHHRHPTGDEGGPLLSATGRAFGRVALAASRTVTRLDVRATAPWTVRVVRPSAARSFDGSTEGNGPDVLAYTGSAGRMRVFRRGRRRFEVRALSASLEPALILLTVKGDVDTFVSLPGPCVLALLGEGSWRLNSAHR